MAENRTPFLVSATTCFGLLVTGVGATTNNAHAGTGLGLKKNSSSSPYVAVIRAIGKKVSKPIELDKPLSETSERELAASVGKNIFPKSFRVDVGKGKNALTRTFRREGPVTCDNGTVSKDGKRYNSPPGCKTSYLIDGVSYSQEIEVRNPVKTSGKFIHFTRK